MEPEGYEDEDLRPPYSAGYETTIVILTQHPLREDEVERLLNGDLLEMEAVEL